MNYELRSIEAWREPEEGWYWNQSFHCEKVEFADPTPRKVLQWLRENEYLTETSKGKVLVEDHGDVIEIIKKNTGEPIYAFLEIIE
jgi:hypothetical protein